MGKHGLSSCEKGVQRSPIREKGRQLGSPIKEKDKATFDEPALKKTAKKKPAKKVEQDVANDQASDSEAPEGNESPVNAG